MLLGASLALGLLCLNPTGAAPSLEVFPGQWMEYHWEGIENSNGWFPGHVDALWFVANSVYSILGVSGAYQASVRMQGTIRWPPDSINRSLLLLTVRSDGSMDWEPLSERTTFDYSHFATVSPDDGKVLAMYGAIALHASYAYADSPYSASCFFLQDQPEARSVYFFGEVDAAVGSYVDAWSSGLAEVLGRYQLETRLGPRPAIFLFHSESTSLPPAWSDAEELALQYDRDTGFLLELRQVLQTWVNVTRTNRWDVTGYILATNMYEPRPGPLLAEAILAGTCIGALVVMLLVSRWILRGQRRDKSSS
jgi:hypothetical protein